jgi:hypothetical protein
MAKIAINIYQGISASASRTFVKDPEFVDLRSLQRYTDQQRLLNGQEVT